MENIIEIWTDGACSGNPGPGGCSAILIYPDKEIKKISKYEEKTTNQRMEINGIIIAIEEIIKNFSLYKNINIYSDSAYVCNCFNQKWYKNWISNGWINSKKESVKNKDLWEYLFDKLLILKNQEYIINFIKIKGHSDNIMNQEADRLAVTAIKNKGDFNG